mgnify:CR=1 FL=1
MFAGIWPGYSLGFWDRELYVGQPYTIIVPIFLEILFKQSLSVCPKSDFHMYIISAGDNDRVV